MTDARAKDRRQNIAGYDAWSSTYDSDPNSTVFADERAFPTTWKTVRGQRVLELGCGTGRHTEKLVAQSNDVTALDLSAGMLAVAREKPALSRVRFLQIDVYAYQVSKGEEFDVVVAALVLEHLRDLPAFFHRVNGWLKAGGNAYFSEIHPSRMQAGSGARFQRGEEEIRLSSIAHREGDFRSAIVGAGLILEAKQEILATPELLVEHAAWEKYRDKPMLQIWSMRKS